MVAKLCSSPPSGNSFWNICSVSFGKPDNETHYHSGICAFCIEALLKNTPRRNTAAIGGAR